MNQRVITAVAVAAIASGALVWLAPEDLGDAPDVPMVPHPELSRVVGLPDGGKGYVLPADLEDGGTEWLVTSVAPCVRRPVDAGAQCLRRIADGGVVDFGTLNRFPAADAFGEGCEGVACTVIAGQDADESEDAYLARMRDGG